MPRWPSDRDIYTNDPVKPWNQDRRVVGIANNIAEAKRDFRKVETFLENRARNPDPEFSSEHLTAIIRVISGATALESDRFIGRAIDLLQQYKSIRFSGPTSVKNIPRSS